MLSAWRNLLAPWLAPALLCGVALAQFGHAQFSSLSPWKGGGFGMFSTVDSPAARFLRIRLLTSDGEIPIVVPFALRSQAVELRTVATERLVVTFAEALAKGTWVRFRSDFADRHDPNRTDGLERDKQLQKLVPERRLSSRFGAVAVTDGGRNVMRLLAKNETPKAVEETIDVGSVRVELWKYSFDAATTTLNAEKRFTVTAASSR